MELLQTAHSLFGSLARVVGWLQNRANPARRQAARILEAPICVTPAAALQAYARRFLPARE